MGLGENEVERALRGPRVIQWQWTPAPCPQGQGAHTAPPSNINILVRERRGRPQAGQAGLPSLPAYNISLLADRPGS